MIPACLRSWIHYHEPATRWGKMFLLSVVVGILAGGAAAGLHYALHEGVEALIGRFSHIGGPGWWTFRWEILLLPAIGGLASGLLVQGIFRLGPGHGTNVFVSAFHEHGGHLPLRGPSVKAVAAVGVISCGGSAGPEGPVAALGASIGSRLAEWCGLAPRQRRVLLVAGCAAGVGAIFQCPLGGALFATSVLYRESEFETDSIVSSVIASIISYSTFMAIFGFGRHLLQGAEPLVFTHPLELIPYAVLGLVCGLLSIFFYFCMHTVESRPLRRLHLPAWLVPALGGLLVGLLGCALPQVMDARYQFIQNALDGRLFAASGAAGLSWGQWALLFGLIAVVKCVATALTVGSGASGGLLGPSVFIGGVAGAFVGACFMAVAPESISPEIMEKTRQALIPVGMAGVLAASMRTPLAAIVMVTEMTGSYGLIVPLMLVCVSAYLIGWHWGLNPAQVRSASESPAHAGDLLVHLLESFHVRDLMEPRWPFRVTPSATLGEMIGGLVSGSRPVFAVLEGSRLAGVISLPDISRAVSEPGISEIVIASDIMTTPPALLHPEENLYDVLERFRSVSHEVLPVVSLDQEETFLGMLSRQSIHQALRRHVGEIRRHLYSEHAGLQAIEQDEQLYQLVAGVSSAGSDAIQRIPVPLEVVGESLRGIDFRNKYGMQVIGIQDEGGELQCPPDINRPLRADQMLVVIVPQDAA